MKSIKILTAGTLLVIITLIVVSFITIKPAYMRAVKPVALPGFAVVELFTSEGCSSCPPADELVAKIQKEVNGQPIYILAFHVDYWNRLGWKDVFSDAAYSKRQADYARYLNISSPYTPQIVVNGKTEFVGSQEGNLRNAIKAALKTAPAVKIELDDIKTTEKQVSVHYAVDGNSSNSALLLVVVEKSAKTVVKAGENSGRTLSHIQIVRNLQSISLKNNKSGISNVTLPGGSNINNCELVALIQNTITGEISAATKVNFPAATI